MKKLITPILVFAALVGGFFAARELDAQVTYSPRRGTTLVGTADPSSGGGVAAAEGTIYVRTGATDQVWWKTGSAATAWTNLGGGAATFSSLTVTGRTTSAGFTSSIDGDATTPAYNLTNNTNMGLYRSASNQLSVALAGTEQLRFNTSAITTINNLQANAAIFGVGGNLTMSASRHIILSGGYVQLQEMAAPGAGAADTVRLYAVVDGGSKTDGAAIFQSGAVQTWAQEP